jgi:hypothetical protein
MKDQIAATGLEQAGRGRPARLRREPPHDSVRIGALGYWLARRLTSIARRLIFWFKVESGMRSPSAASVWL